MPAYDRLAYSDGRCYNMKKSDLEAKNLRAARPAGDAAGTEMERILDFLQVKVIGKGPMTRATCIGTGAKNRTSAKKYRIESTFPGLTPSVVA
jgi:hypothetical protein